MKHHKIALVSPDVLISNKKGQLCLNEETFVLLMNHGYEHIVLYGKSNLEESVYSDNVYEEANLQEEMKKLRYDSFILSSKKALNDGEKFQCFIKSNEKEKIQTKFIVLDQLSLLRQSDSNKFSFLIENIREKMDPSDVLLIDIYDAPLKDSQNFFVKEFQSKANKEICNKNNVILCSTSAEQENLKILDHFIEKKLKGLNIHDRFIKMTNKLIKVPQDEPEYENCYLYLFCQLIIDIKKETSKYREKTDARIRLQSRDQERDQSINTLISSAVQLALDASLTSKQKFNNLRQVLIDERINTLDSHQKNSTYKFTNNLSKVSVFSFFGVRATESHLVRDAYEPLLLKYYSQEEYNELVSNQSNKLSSLYYFGAKVLAAISAAWMVFDLFAV